MYTQTSNPNQVRRDSDGALISCAPGFFIPEEYQAWLAAGNVPKPVPLVSVQADRLTAIEQAYQALVSAPVAYMGTTFQADRDSQILLDQAIAVYARQGATPAGFWWKDVANAHVPMTLAQLQGLGDAIAARVWGAFQILDARKASIRAATTVAQAEGVVW